MATTLIFVVPKKPSDLDLYEMQKGVAHAIGCNMCDVEVEILDAQEQDERRDGQNIQGQ